MTTDDAMNDADTTVAAQAAAWVLRQDRGLTAVEQDEFSQWLASDAKHRAAFAEHADGWGELDRLAGLQTSLSALPDPDLLAPLPRRSHRRWIPLVPLALAAGLAMGIFFRSDDAVKPIPVSVPRVASAAGEEQLLPDGSRIKLNRGANLLVEFTPAERRIRLVQGEATFEVTKNALRPFIVVAHGVEVRAVGTAFNVRMGSSAVEVLVTEGKVRVQKQDEHAPTGLNEIIPLLHAGERATVPIVTGAPTPIVATLSEEQIATELAWQPRLIDFANAPLSEFAEEFNRHNDVRLTIDDSALREMRLSASFRSDNVEGFVRLMESDFNVRAERSAGEIRLHR